MVQPARRHLGCERCCWQPSFAQVPVVSLRGWPLLPVHGAGAIRPCRKGESPDDSAALSSIAAVLPTPGPACPVYCWSVHLYWCDKPLRRPARKFFKPRHPENGSTATLFAACSCFVRLSPARRPIRDKLLTIDALARGLITRTWKFPSPGEREIHGRVPAGLLSATRIKNQSSVVKLLPLTRS